MEDYTKILASLSPEKRKLLEKKLHEKSKEFNAFPLSFAQQRLWLLYQLEPESAAYNIPAVVRLQGELNIHALQRSLDAIVQRHEVLRTVFTTINGKPMQTVARSTAVPLVQKDFSNLPQKEREEEAKQTIISESKQPFDLSRGPLLRSILYRMGPEEHILLLAMHHIVSDGWSIGVLIRELTVLYQSFCDPTPTESPLPALPIQYPDFASWQRKWLQGEVLEKQLAYWKKQLEDIPPILDLPTDRPRPALQTNHGAHLAKVFPVTLLEAIKTLSQHEGVTPFMTLLAAFQTLLFRYTGEQDICIGTPIANRNRAETEGLIGFFVNTLVMRANLTGDPSFHEVLQRVREMALGAYAHQDLPFEMLVEELQPVRDMSHTPLFQIMFTHASGKDLKIEMKGLLVEPLEFESGSSQFDLTLSVTEMADGMLASIEYNTDLFDSATIERLLSSYRILLEDCTAHPEQRISKLSILTEDERRQVLSDWNQTKVEFRLDPVHVLFEKQVERTPDAAALISGDSALTYKELNNRANQFAHRLKQAGIGLETLVGLYLERSANLIVALLAIVKAGGAYVPIDPTYPTERVQFILEDSGANVLLTEKTLVQNLPVNAAHVICVDEDIAVVGDAGENLRCPLALENLAYIIYTSGSTGKPKGVQIQHGNLTNYVLHARREFALTPEDRVLQFASVSFDAAAEEIFPALASGATLVLRNDEMISSASAFVRACDSLKITVADLPTAFWHQLTQSIESEQLVLAESLRLVIIGGENAAPERLAQWQKNTDGSIRLVNTYGPTEATIVATSWNTVEPSSHDGLLKSVPIGRPVSNVQAYVLDQHFLPVSIGMVGELCLGGAGIARGYLKRPNLTAEKFIPNPFSDQKGGRLYRTGDLARFLANGDIEFLGRIDHQVKIRGFRIELGEIETALRQHPGVQDVVVVSEEDAQHVNYLIAYFVPLHHPTPSVDELRSHLKANLPDYMVPSFFIEIDSIPLNAQGKVNKKALPKLDRSKQAGLREYAAARTPTEELLADIFAGVLQIQRVGIQDSFFDLGGHSLLGTQLTSRIRDTFGQELPLRVLFESPTVAGLAQHISKHSKSGSASLAPVIGRVSRGEDMPLSFAQQRLWFLDQLEPGTPFYNIPDAVLISGALNIGALCQSLEEIVHRHEVLRTNIVTEEGQPKLIIAEEPADFFSAVDLCEWPDNSRDAEVKRLALEEAQKPFDLAKDSLLRATLLQLGPTENVVLLTMHHIASDGWSTGILIKELAMLYEAFSHNQPSPLPDLPIQYADFAHWQRNWLQGDVLQGEIDFWKSQLQDAPTVLNLPTDRPRPATQTFHGAHKTFTLSSELSKRIVEFSRAEGATLFMTLLSGFQSLLYRYTGQADICIGTPIANRNRSEIENLIGFFVNTLVLRTDLGGQPSFRQAVRRVKEVAFAAYAHQDLPFEKLVDAIQPQRDLSHTPLFQVMFVMQNVPAQELRLPDLVFQSLPVDSGISQFDLTLTMAESDGMLGGAIEYNTDLFDASRMDRLVEHLQVLLESAMAKPEQSIAHLPMMTEPEKQTLLVEWNRTEAEYPRNSCLHQLFAEQAKETPDAIALVAETGQLTYQALNQRANQLAHYLQNMGVRDGDLIGLCLERSAELLIGLLAIFKTGAAYLPLDPKYPVERLSFMLNDANVRIVLTQEKLSKEIGIPESELSNLNLISIDADWPKIEVENDSDPNVPVSAENPAYVIYTSGSTGKPKGVLVSHRSVVNHNFSVIRHFELTARDRMLQFASINFDAALEEIFPTWLAGGTLVLRPEGALPSGLELMQLIRQQQLSVLDLPTAYWHEWVYELSLLRETIPDSLRLVIIGGEKALAERYTLWRSMVGSKVRLLNTYGPTETTIVSAIYDPDSNLDESKSVDDLPIGRPIANTQAYILDANLQPVPIGVAGELHIGGDGLAIGYLNRPELTRERFIPNPFSSDPKARLYKTGDLTRYLEDGNIQYLGRVDDQIKIRGFRVELGEIETALSGHPAVREVAVMAREEKAGDKRLVAYLVTAGEKPAINELREHLKGQLPDYMIPSAFVLLESLPRTPNGKIDRRALPEPEQLEPDSEESSSAPTSVIEEKLTEIWRQVLGVSKVGIRDSFFELGGDSILSIQVVAKAHREGLVITPKQFFENPTIEALAKVVGTGQAVMAEQGMVTGSVSLTPIMHWFFEQNLPEAYHWNQSIMVQVKERLDIIILKKLIGELLRHHDVLRLRLKESGESWQACIAETVNQIPVSEIDLSETSQEEKAARIKIEATRVQASLNLSEGPLLRVTLFRMGDEVPDRLLFVIHHLVVDGVSWRIFLEDLVAGYEQLKRQQEIKWPAKSTSFKQWSEKLQDYAQSPKILEELSYWKSQRVATMKSLPVDYPAVRNDEASAQTVDVALDKEETQAILSEVPSAFRTQINDVLLTALLEAAAKLTGANSLLVELEGHGRENIFDDVDLSRTIGWFTTTFPVLLKQEGSTLADRLKAVKEQVRRIPAHGIGYGILRYLSYNSDIRNELRVAQQAEVSFNYLGQVDQILPDSAPFMPATESKGSDRSLRGARSHVLELTSVVSGGKMLFSWTYSAHLHKRETIEKLAEGYLSALRSIIALCKMPTTGGYTPSDFPLAKLNQKQLDKMMDRLSKRKDKVTA